MFKRTFYDNIGRGFIN